MRWILPVLLALGACNRGLGDAGWYTAALAEKSYGAAASDCRKIHAADSREDCLLAAMSQNNRLQDADCAELTVSKWHEECLFMLGERISASGNLALGLQTCERSRFARSCTWHLLQDKVQATMDQPPATAERVLDHFQRVPSLPDATYQFWVIRLREAAELGRPVDEADCIPSRDPAACRRAVEAHVRRILDTLGRGGLASACKAAPGARATTGGKPAWLPGPITLAVEANWVREKCR